MGGTEGRGSDRNRLALNIRTTSGNTRGVTALGMDLMKSIISVSAARLISFDYRQAVCKVEMEIIGCMR